MSRPLSAVARAYLCEQLAPGGRVIRVKTLKGGLSCIVQAVRIERGDGSAFEVVTRRMNPMWDNCEDTAEREFRVLEVLTRHSVPTARPLLLDKTGTHLGQPAV